LAVAASALVDPAVLVAGQEVQAAPEAEVDVAAQTSAAATRSATGKTNHRRLSGR